MHRCKCANAICANVQFGVCGCVAKFVIVTNLYACKCVSAQQLECEHVCVCSAVAVQLCAVHTLVQMQLYDDASLPLCMSEVCMCEFAQIRATVNARACEHIRAHVTVCTGS